MTPAGTTIAGRYRVLRPLGRGGMAVVFEALDERLQRRVAVKVFEGLGEDDARRATAEMHTLAALAHPGLVTVYDAGTEADRSYLVMELVEGETLADRIARGPLAHAETATLGARLAAGLAYIHQRDIVHRDVKPANILLPRRDHDDTEAAKLVDFGIAQHVGAERLTRTGTTIGTAAYLSPEQVTGKPVGPAADVYALGLVLLEALGRSPGWTGTPIEIAIARLTAPPVVPDDLGPTWAPLLRAMTASDPGARPPAARVREALTAAAAGTEVLDTALIDTRDATTVLPAAGGPSSTRLLPSAPGAPPPVRPMRTEAVPIVPLGTDPDDGRRRRRGLLLVGGLVAGLAALAVVLGVALGGGAGDTTTPVGDATTPTAAMTSTPATAATPVGATSEAATSDTPTAADTPTAVDTPTAADTPSAPDTPTAADTPVGPGGGGPGNGNGGPGKPNKTKPGKP